GRARGEDLLPGPRLTGAGRRGRATPRRVFGEFSEGPSGPFGTLTWDGRAFLAVLWHMRCRSGERVPPMGRLHKRGGAPSADNGEDPRAVFVQARLRWKPSRHSTHLADLKSPQKLVGRPDES